MTAIIRYLCKCSAVCAVNAYDAFFRWLKEGWRTAICCPSGPVLAYGFASLAKFYRE